ncbi:hypothetical protein CPA40_03015 [Bifidobacterium callitrichos]|jgi:hypothetical protein|uniref:Uncharacterized protein n=5 Tax=Bifidobacterium TaxID=1678 RepID=A0A2T3GBS8_9BIFI|nr:MULTISPECIES: hypothetical protein [Bifidobacterium]KAA8830435.1 hypothetical protein EMO89_05475 [Bifidobacterium tissieri]PST46944.1 hypothetical protein CPA40_03015 [Bifidobacterium callitrichos]QOL45200.1 hypothetical protein BL1347_04030 [Bifidobacterium longum subsp. infantis]
MKSKRYFQVISVIALIYVCMTGVLMFQVSAAYSQWEEDQVFWNLATLVSAETEKANAQKFGLTEFERPELPEYADPSHKYSIFAWKLLKEKNDIIASDELMKQQTESHLEYANSVLNEYNRRN